MNAITAIVTQEQVRLRIEDFFRLDQDGLFGDRRTELIDGKVYVLAAQYSPHARLKINIAFALRDALRRTRPDLHVLAEATVAMPPFDAPEPDIVVTSNPFEDGAVPVESVALIIEVASTTLRDDLGAKKSVYATHGVPEYWVADLKGGAVHQFWQPADGDYAETRVVRLSEPIEAATIENIAISPEF